MVEQQPVSWGRTIRLLLGRRWWWVTLLVLGGCALLVRLGIWQLDRLAWRRELNAAIAVQMAAAPLTVTPNTAAGELADIAYRQVTATGYYDLAGQFVLLQQNYNGQSGVYLFAPLLLDGDDRALLVNRGWLPADQAEPVAWGAYDITEQVTVTGFMQASQKPPRATLADYTNDIAHPETGWHWPFVAAIQQQYPYTLLPGYLQLEPTATSPTQLPYPVAAEVDLSEGNHLSYAYQWFAFALTLAVIYLFLVRRQESQPSRTAPASR